MKLDEILADKNKGARLARNVLSRAFRDILKELNIEAEHFNVLMEVYLRDKNREGYVDDKVKLANDRGNLKKEIEKDEYTIKVFMKLMKLLRLRDFSITFEGTFHDGYKLGNGNGLRYNIDLELSDEELDMKLPKEFIEGFNEEIESYSEDEESSED